MDWFLSRTPYLQGVIFADLCASFFFDGAIHPLLHQFYVLYEQGRIAAPWLASEIVSMLRYWRGEKVVPEDFMTMPAGKRKPVVTAAQAFALGSQCLFRNDAEALTWCSKGLSLLKKERQMRTSVHIGQYAGLCVDLTRFLFGEYKDLEQMRENCLRCARPDAAARIADQLLAAARMPAILCTRPHAFSQDHLTELTGAAGH